MLSCRQATEFISQALDRALTMREHSALLVHLAICKGCRATSGHMQFLRRAALAWRGKHSVPPPNDEHSHGHGKD